MDVKPSNILVTADGQPMLLDFHLAREPIPIGEPPADVVGGTPGYMSPEQAAVMTAMAAGRAVPGPVDARSDLYSLASVLAEMLGGAAPSAGRLATAGIVALHAWRLDRTRGTDLQVPGDRPGKPVSDRTGIRR